MIAFDLALNTIRRTVLHPLFLLTLGVALLIVFLGFWKFTELTRPDNFEKFAVFRGLILIATAAVAYPFALSRTLTAERTLLNERYQTGVEMLARIRHRLPDFRRRLL